VSATVLVVAGEPSGDRAAAKVVLRLAERGARAFGLVGPACESAGAEACARMGAPALGALDVAARAGSVLRAMHAVRAAVRARRPAVALLVNYSEFNARLLGFLRRRGVRVVWYAAPQIWAWRPRRGRAIARGADAMAVILPFEEALWRARGARARYVGHPSMEVDRLDRASARAELGLAPGARAVAVMPGSRAHEVRRLLPAMLDATSGGPAARVLLTTALDPDTRAWARARADAARVPVWDVAADEGAPRVLAAFDQALCASGTASLECAMAGVPPVVAYRVDPLAALVARRALRTAHVALPNVLLGRRAFPELLQRDARAGAMRDALASLAASSDRAAADCAEVRGVLGAGHAPSCAVAEMIRSCL
jgi:lipid-A-disaccharide synthase